MDNPGHYLMVLIYVFAMMFQIYLPCYVGTIVTYKSKQVFGTLFMCNWIEQSRHFKLLLLVFSERAKQSVEPLAGGLFPLKMSMFFSVLI